MTMDNTKQEINELIKQLDAEKEQRRREHVLLSNEWRHYLGLTSEEKAQIKVVLMIATEAHRKAEGSRKAKLSAEQRKSIILRAKEKLLAKRPPEEKKTQETIPAEQVKTFSWSASARRPIRR